MKKIFTLLFAGTALLTATTALAETKTVSNKADFISAFGANTDTIFITTDIAAGSFNQTSTWPTAGNIHIIGVEKEDGTLPLFTMRGNKQPKHEEYISLHFENLQLMGEGNNYFLYYNDADEHNYDTLEFKNCEIHGTSRAFIRFAASAREKDGETITAAGTIKSFIMTGCTYHDGYLDSNAMPILYFGTMVESMDIENNLFYDMGYVNSLVGYNYLNGNTAIDLDFTFKNNTVIGGTMKNAMLGFGSYVGQNSTFTIQNNFFLNPNWKDTYNNPSITDEVLAENPDTLNTIVGNYIANITYGLIDFDSNVLFGNRAAKNTTSTDAETGEIYGEWSDISSGTQYYTMEDVEFGWDKFTDAKGGLFGIWKQEKVYTAGKDGEPIGCIDLYTDEHQTTTTVTVSVEGSKSAKVTITPNKAKYLSGEVVTLSVDLKNTNYRQFNTFKHWEDGSTALTRTVTLGAENNFVATVEALPVLSAFTFAGVSGNANASYKADIYDDEAYQATAYELVYDTVGYVDNLIAPPFTQHATTEDGYAVIQARPNKFGEDDVNAQMGVISRHTPASVVTLGEQEPHAVVVEFSTKDQSGIAFSCFVGSDNYACKTQNLYWSLNGTEWTKFASVELTERAATFEKGEGQLFGWEELKGDLPAEVNNQEKVYVKVVGDMAGEKAWNTVNGEIVPYGGVTHNESTNKDEWIGSDLFEYVGNILITASSLNGIKAIPVDTKPALVEDNAPVYNILGQLVASPVAGQLYFKNGKKYIVK